MLYYLTAAGLIAHTFFWGLGLAWLAGPREWRRWSWVFAPAFGWALQSAVVWVGAHSPMAGTDHYARATELLPLVLLIVALIRRRGSRPRGWIMVSVVAVAAGWMLLSPMTKLGRGLTTSSMGSCDQADYAAGARTFQEFSQDDRTGFLGLPEVTKVRSADYFFDFWLRLNHFTPSALLAHNASVFGVESYRLISVTAAVLVLLNVPMVMFLTRALVGVKGLSLAGVVALYALSPLNAYAVHNGALGQLYAVQGIALLTLATIGAARAAQGGRSVWPFLPPVLAAAWLLAGSYNFILLVCLAPAGAWLLGQWMLKRNFGATLRVAAMLGGASVLCVIVFWGRFEGLVERFSLFEQYDFGWAVPLASPEGWLGMLRDTGLHAWPQAVRVALSVAVVGLYAWGIVRLWLRQRWHALAALALVLPVVAGWGMLAWEARVRTNASYDAYKILAVFHPGLLAGLGCWLATMPRTSRTGLRVAFALLALILAANLQVANEFRVQMATPPLRVDRRLVELGRFENDPRVISLNMTIGDFWSRLWANAFLLRRPQYFATHSYEGRLNTALKGAWDLRDSPLRSAPLAEDDLIRANETFHLVRATALGRLQLEFGDGWYPAENEGSNRWRWASGTGHILVANPSPHSLRTQLTIRVRGLAAGPLELRVGEKSAGTKSMEASLHDMTFENLVIPPGGSVLSLVAAAGAVPGGTDDRKLSFALYDFEIRSLAFEK